VISDRDVGIFKAFGFLMRKRLFSADEVDRMTKEADDCWRPMLASRVDDGDDLRVGSFVEQNSTLLALLEDDRIYLTVEQLLGPDFLWVGSEGNVSLGRGSAKWHPDRKCYRPGEQENIHYRRIKIMIYLDSVSKDSGCLRVIPGSHQAPFHYDLGIQEIDPDAMPFGVSGPDIPGYPIESEPGDMIIFDHCLWHSAFGAKRGRRYIALKFTAPPANQGDIDSMERYANGMFEIHESMSSSKSARIRRMIKDIESIAVRRRGVSQS
jgi:hypothetical protein